MNWSWDTQKQKSWQKEGKSNQKEPMSSRGMEREILPQFPGMLARGQTEVPQKAFRCRYKGDHQRRGRDT